MKNKIQFNLSRLTLMLKYDFNKYWKKSLLIIGGSLVAISILSLLMCMTGDGHFVIHEGHTAFFPMILIFVGGLLVSFSFKDLDRDPERISYLALPASHLEKYTSRFILTAIVLPLFISIVYSLYAFIFYDNIFPLLTDGKEHLQRFSFFSHVFKGTPTPFDFLKMFFALHSALFLGAITFRKLAVFKTLISGFLLIVSSAALVYLLTMLLLPELFVGGGFLVDPKVEPNLWLQEKAEGYGQDLMYSMIFFVTPLVFWLIGYFKLTEKEV